MRAENDAERVSEAVDRLLRDPDGAPAELAELGLLPAARRLARLPSLLGPVDPAFEQRTMRRMGMAARGGLVRPRVRLGWIAAGLAALLLLVTLFTPLGQTAVASFLAVFRLGRTEVRIAPVDTPTIPAATASYDGAVEEQLTLAQAQAKMPFALPQPAYLPQGYAFEKARSYSYPDLAAWMPQPLSVELVYGNGAGQECTLRLYPIILGDHASISGMNLEAAPIQEVEKVDVNGQPGVLLQLGIKGAQATWQEVVWEQEDLILALSTSSLPRDDLLEIARSVH